MPTNCDEIDGDILIGPNFIGPFVLDGITRITGILSLTPTQRYNASSQVTSILMNDLEYLARFEIGWPFGNSYVLDTISFPTLKEIDDLTVEGVVRTNFDFPALLDARQLSITGKISR